MPGRIDPPRPRLLRGHLPHVSAALALTAACAPASTPFDPTGDAAEVYGEWDVNGRAPDADVCARAGIATIAIEWTDVADEERVIPEGFRFPCAEGYFDSPMPMLRAGALGYRWLAYDASGAVLLQSQRYTVGVFEGVEAVLQAVNFVRRVGVQVNVTARYEGDLAFGDCGSAQVDAFSWELRAGTVAGAVVAASNGEDPCASSFVIEDLPTGVLMAGSYVLSVRASATDGALWSGDCTVEVFESGPSSVVCDVPRAP